MGEVLACAGDGFVRGVGLLRPAVSVACIETPTAKRTRWHEEARPVCDVGGDWWRRRPAAGNRHVDGSRSVPGLLYAALGQDSRRDACGDHASLVGSPAAVLPAETGRAHVRANCICLQSRRAGGGRDDLSQPLDDGGEARMSIWKDALTPELLNAHLRGGLVGHLGIMFTEVGEDWISASMPVDERSRQPAGILHGGASVALAESIGSTAANLVIDRERQLAVGLDINANHIRTVKSGMVTGTARPLHLGRTTQVWEIRIVDEADRLVCICRLTMSVLDR